MSRRKTAVLLAAAYIALLVLHRFIYLMGDDFFYAGFTKSAETFVDMHISHYAQTNGRALIHIAVSLLLIFDVYLWRFINPAVILLTLCLIDRAAFGEKNRAGALPILIPLFFLFGAGVTRESVYWLDGSVNYLYPMALVLFSYNLYKNPPDKPGLCYAVFFISGATAEQSGLILLGLFFIGALPRPNKRKIISFVAVLLGYFTVVFSPGTLGRIKLQGTPGRSGEFLKSAMYAANLTFFNKTIFFIHIILLGSCFFYLYKKRRAFDKVLCALCFISAVFYIAARFVTVDAAAPYAAFIAVYVFILFYVHINMFLENKHDATELSFITAAFGAQGILVFSGVFGERTLLPCILCLMVPAVKALTRHKLRYILAPLLIFGAVVFSHTASGYYNNAKIHRYNIEAAASGTGEIVLKKCDPEYCVSPLHESEYHLRWFRIHYNVPEDAAVSFAD